MKLDAGKLQEIFGDKFEVKFAEDDKTILVVTPLIYPHSGDNVVIRIRKRAVSNFIQIDDNGEAHQYDLTNALERVFEDFAFNLNIKFNKETKVIKSELYIGGYPQQSALEMLHERVVFVALASLNFAALQNMEGQ